MATVKAQSAIEFLMTYGWAILIVLSVVAVLFYTGVFNPSTVAPTMCVLGAGFACQGYLIDTAGNLTIDLGQSTGNSVNITGIACDTSSSPTSWKSVSQTIENGRHAVITGVPCKKDGAAPKAGDYYKGTIFINYTDKETGMSHKVKGEVSYKIGSG